MIISICSHFRVVSFLLLFTEHSLSTTISCIRINKFINLGVEVMICPLMNIHHHHLPQMIIKVLMHTKPVVLYPTGGGDRHDQVYIFTPAQHWPNNQSHHPKMMIITRRYTNRNLGTRIYIVTPIIRPFVFEQHSLFFIL